MDNSDAALSPFVEIPRSDWADLAKSTETPLTQAEIEKSAVSVTFSIWQKLAISTYRLASC